MLAGRVGNRGTTALAIITAGAPAEIADLKGKSPAPSSVVQGSVIAGLTSVFAEACPSPGKCLMTGMTPPAVSPAANAAASAAVVVGLRLKDRVPSGS